MHEKSNKNLSRSIKRKSKRKILKWVLLITLLILISVMTLTGYASFKINEFMHNTSDTSVVNPKDPDKSSEENEKAKPLEDKPFALLMFGEDYRPETGSLNTDAIIVSIWNPETKKVSLLSIPRDTKVDIPGYGEGKINSVYALGEKEKKEQISRGETPTTDGSYMLMNVLSDYLDIPINYYAKVDFKGFELIIDEIGGIEIDVDRDMVYYSAADGTNINLKKGLQVLDGKEALDYARFRKSSDGNDSSDFERNQRHQQIIKSLADSLASFNGVANMFDILDISGEHIKTNFTPKEMTALFWKYKDLATSDIQSIKMDSYWQTPYVYVNDEELARVQTELKKAYAVSTEESLFSQE